MVLLQRLSCSSTILNFMEGLLLQSYDQIPITTPGSDPILD